MLQREQKFKDWLCGRMKPWWFYEYHEDKNNKDIADVSFCCENRVGKTTEQSNRIQGVHGWIEFKTLREYPKRYPLKFDKFTAGQKQWLTDRNNTAGHCFMVFNIEESKEIFIMIPNQFKFIGTWRIEDYRLYCPRWTMTNFSPSTFARIISGFEPTQLLKIIP